jgi:predicted nucleic acid-binding protein
MSTVFADSSYFIALLVREDAAHQAALAFACRFSGAMATSDWVLVEVADALCRPRNRRMAVAFLTQFAAHGAVEVIPADRATYFKGLELFAARLDKSWSLTDCISFELMRERSYHDALATDRHFAQAGFNVLLSPDSK